MDHICRCENEKTLGLFVKQQDYDKHSDSTAPSFSPSIINHNSHILIWLYVKLLFKVILLILILIVLVKFVLIVNQDFNTKIDILNTIERQKYLECSENYHLNHCHSDTDEEIVPALKEICNEYFLCMSNSNNNKTTMKSKLIVSIFSELINEFVSTIHYKSMVLLLLVMIIILKVLVL
ncbi:Brr6p SCDLUD_002259 [Saccharomycodes ludwigii]|uniref:Brr6p n=1 Tax=Saccharomycodes ludwigii TaxID=36035 RepID=UPI001E8803F4|nr:hypothetical protein SCDLUD_002259 [Saccharomycodes ludwigii]KAH3900806.1 hypothetical protein SCDLUD_002259 [Saccharomycodes ludwigii]